jgi:hypothetical protein
LHNLKENSVHGFTDSYDYTYKGLKRNLKQQLEGDENKEKRKRKREAFDLDEEEYLQMYIFVACCRLNFRKCSFSSLLITTYHKDSSSSGIYIYIYINIYAHTHTHRDTY